MRHTCDHGVGVGPHLCDCEEFVHSHTANQYDVELMGYLPRLLSEGHWR